MLPRAEWPIEEPGSHESVPWDALVSHHFPEGKNSNVSTGVPHRRVVSCCAALSLTAVWLQLPPATEWGKAAPFSSSHHYIFSQFKLVSVAEAATFLPNFRSSDSVFSLLFSATETKLSLTSPERYGWLMAGCTRVKATQHKSIPDNLTDKMKLNS